MPHSAPVEDHLKTVAEGAKAMRSTATTLFSNPATRIALTAPYQPRMSFDEWKPPLSLPMNCPARSTKSAANWPRRRRSYARQSAKAGHQSSDHRVAQAAQKSATLSN
jgi:hypothetical protein